MARSDTKPADPTSRMAVDSNGGVAYDPSKNVLDLVEAERRRQDDLRDLNNRRIDAEIRHQEAMANLRAEHAKEIREIETKRLDAIRQVDVLAVSTAADRAQAAIQALAATTTGNAENLRVLVTSTATTIAAQTANTITAITERLGALEKSSYEGKGKQALADPMLTELVQEMKSLRESRAGGEGKSAGGQQMWAYVAAAVGIIFAAITLAMRIGATP